MTTPAEDQAWNTLRRLESLLRSERLTNVRAEVNFETFKVLPPSERFVAWAYSHDEGASRGYYGASVAACLLELVAAEEKRG